VTLFRNRKIFVILVVVVLFGAAGAGLAIVHAKSSPKTPAAAPYHSPAAVVSATPLFSFDASKAPDWKQGPGNNTSMALFTKTQGCFASVEVKKGTADEPQALSKVTAGFTEQGYGVKALSPITTAFSVSNDPAGISYVLHPYALTGVGQGGYKTQAFGYVTLPNRYISVQAYCSDDTTLPQITDALSAFILKSE
jgi:hypothetical protein